MFRPRVIPVLLLKNQGLVKTIGFAKPRYIGDPINAVRIFNDLKADELVFLDILATKERRLISLEFVKNVGEAFLRSYKQEYGVNYTIFRFFNTFGPKQSRDFVISRFLLRALENKDIPIYGDGKQTRTFCYIEDNVDACVKCFAENHIVNDVINVGGNIETPILDLANLIIKLTDSKSKIVFLPPLKDGDMSRRLPDNARMQEILGRPLLPLEQGIKKIIETGLFEANVEG